MLPMTGKKIAANCIPTIFFVVMRFVVCSIVLFSLLPASYMMFSFYHKQVTVRAAIVISLVS